MIRGLWTREVIGWLLAGSLLPVVAVLVAGEGLPAAVGFGAAFAAATLWQLVFRFGAGIPLSPSGALTAVALALLAPAGAAPWQLMLGASFGIVLGELVFGGWGRNVIGAPALALAFLYLSFPTLPAPRPEAATALAAAASGLLLLAAGILNWRVVIAAAAACAAVLAAAGADPVGMATSGALIFGLVYLVGDPVAAAATNPGRWLYGALAGSLVALLAAAGPGIDAPEPIVFAALLAAVFAPLLDHLVIAFNARSRPHG